VKDRTAPVDSLGVSDTVSRRALLGLGLRHLTAPGDAATHDRGDPSSPGERGPAVQARWNIAWDACEDMGLWEEAAATLVRCAACATGERVLDAGAGDGNVALLCARRGAQVTACEPAAALRERGRASADRDGLSVEWVEGALEALPFPDATFDRVLAGLAAVFCLQPPTATLAELFRVVRPGGTVGFSAWRSVGLVGGLLRLAQRWDPLPGEVPGPLAWGSEERLRQEVEPFGGEQAQFQLATLAMRFADEEEASQTQRMTYREFAESPNHRMLGHPTSSETTHASATCGCSLQARAFDRVWLDFQQT
jgi:ubiquinone/menaquinone biosynthesis C-methylase UbiE